MTYSAIDRTTTVDYDSAYVADRYGRYDTTSAMSDLRRRVIEATVHLYETIPAGKHIVCQRGRLLDVGYGDGSFIRRMRQCGWKPFGNDINPTKYDGVERVELPIELLPENERYRVITFFDSLEHFEDLTEPKKVARNTDWIFITVPRAPHWFLSEPWKHRRPGEHHFYWWNPRSFEVLFSSKEVTAKLVYFDNPEDVIRGMLPDSLPNTMTCAIRCIQISK